MAIATFGLALVLLAAGLAFDDTTFVKLSPTVGSLAFAAIIALGMLLQPSLLKRTLGYKLQITERGWQNLHIGWVLLSAARAAANEAVWRNASDNAWAIYNGLSDFAWFGLFFFITWLIAHRYWNGPQ